jgi:outer membrane protein
MRHVFVVAVLAAAPALAAQQAAPARLSLAEALSLARSNNPAYRQALNDRGPANWQVRNALSALLLPSISADGGFSYTGAGQQNFLSSSFRQSVSTVSSDYGLGATWQLSGATLSQPGLARAEQRATEADVAGAQRALETGVTQQYLTVLQVRENATLAEKQVERNAQFLRLAEARYAVGQATLIDVRQAQVARGQAEVALLRAQNAVNVEKLRLFESLGVMAPVAIETVVLTDTFAVQPPTWKLDELLAVAAQQNPSLAALRAREAAAGWGVKAATSAFGPSLTFSLGWSGFTQQFTDLNPIIAGQQAAFGKQFADCQEGNQIRASAGLPPIDCSQYDWNAVGATQAASIRQQNSVFPFDFTSQPFQASLRVTLPLFTNFSRMQRVSLARAQHGDLEESVRARGLAVQTEVSQAYLTLVSLHRAIAINDTSRTAAREQLQLATERYRVGSGTFFDLLDAQVATQRAEFDYVNAIYDYHKALATLESAVGKPLR